MTRLAGQRRSNITRTTTTRRRPTEPPPIQMALANRGEDNRNISLLSFLRAIRLPSISTVTLLPAPPYTSGGYPPNGERFRAESTGHQCVERWVASIHHSSAANNSSSRTVAKLVAKSLIAYGMMSSRPCNQAPQVCRECKVSRWFPRFLDGPALHSHGRDRRWGNPPYHLTGLKAIFTKEVTAVAAT